MLENYSSWAQRNGFSNWAIALLWVIVAFICFQIVAAIIFAIAFFFKSLLYGIPEGSSLEVLSKNFGLLFIGNSIGQVLVLAFGTWLFCRLQVSREKRNAFLRFKVNNKTLLFTGLALLAIISVQPFIWFLGWLNSLLPAPEMFDSLQLQQMDVLQSYISNKENFVLLILFHISLIPAFCEEILFRGYVLRSFQRSWGYVTAIIISGIIFGMFHLQATHLLPLIVIGMLLGYLAWIAESIIPAIAAHFLNNAGSVFLVRFFPESEMTSTTAVTLPPVWLILLSIIITFMILHYLYQQRPVRVKI
ncbi:MAG TPA: CPBP family intramembrane glutamic endopeptidase [Balneolaceae bacterium]|nr:CPBP family intramembrane glutamic endopeptidase [Balneolaceae bacterium]